ncbi:50S ribosomal protein L10 [Aminithiophilus ramosus]|uniref:Large ribosomal subunit protein uL10 n=2 Tax=Synergistales TaxID=649776 RepID=A0A9Q7EWJ7_9BACT|nr:50S ribosomal protein L10 [Aminithiophilus ramosus]QTX32874.1 50S ribosomal protein L10 [Aminithiophilus ramosus]QVL36741.1 50S ribosomal protein L10 [Synergistota bacterium]
MPTEFRKQQVADHLEKLQRSEAVFVCEYRGLSVAQLTSIRAKVRKAGGEMKVSRNTLMAIALTEAGLPVPEALMAGPNIYSFAFENAPAVAKVLSEFSKEKGNEKLVVKGGVLGQTVLDAAGVTALADLPPREVLLAQVVGTIAAPLRGLVTVLSGPARGLVTCLSQLKEKKEAA